MPESTASTPAEPETVDEVDTSTRGESPEPKRRRRGTRDPRTCALGDLYPFESHYLELGGPRMHYLDEGDGPPIVMLHGNPTWSFYYRELIKSLRECHRVVVPDHIGCGLSDKPLDYPYTLTTHIANLERLIDSLGLGDVTLAVHDWGGPIGFGWAARHPDRARRFIVFNSSAFLGPLPRRIDVCRWPVFGELFVQGLNGFVRAAFRMACVKRLPRAVRRGYVLPYDTIAHRVGILRFVRDIPADPGTASFDVIQEIDRTLPALADRPLIILWGARDFCFNDEFLHGWLLRFPQATAHCFPEAGHYVVEDALDLIRPELTRFLAVTR